MKQNLQELKQAYEELGNKIKALEEKKNVRWRAEEGEFYHFVNQYGILDAEIEEKHNVDDFRYNTGNYFETEQQAEEYKRRLLLTQRIKDIALELNDGKDIDWNDRNQVKYFLGYNFYYDTVESDGSYMYKDLSCIPCLEKNFLDVVKKRISEEDLMFLFKVE